jgi:hypothetical protein
VRFSVKTYKHLALKTYFKKFRFFFLYNTIVQKNNFKIPQELKNLELKHCKLYNTLTIIIMQNSIYRNYTSLINGLVMIVIPKNTMNLNTLAQFNDTVTLVGVKINNKIYSINQLNLVIKFKYMKDSLDFIKTVKLSLRVLKFSNLILYDSK